VTVATDIAALKARCTALEKRATSTEAKNKTQDTTLVALAARIAKLESTQPVDYGTRLADLEKEVDALKYIITPTGATIGPSGGDDTAAIQAAVNEKGTAGGTITFDPGAYTISTPIALPPGNSSMLTFSGYGATVSLNMETPRFFVWNKTTDHQTFRNFNFLGFVVDAGDNHPVSGSWSVFGFDMKSGGYYDSYYLNIENVTVTDVRVTGVVTSPTSVWNPQGINFVVCQDAPNEATWNHVDDILVQSCRVEGGSRGVSIWAGGPDNLSVTLDRIYIRDCWHDTLATMTASSASSNYHIGQQGRVGTAEVTGCYGNRSGDVGVEMDNTSEGLVENCTMDNAAWEGYFYTHFNVALRGAGSMTWRDCHVNVSTENAWGAGQYGYKVATMGYPIGTANLSNCDYNLTAQGPDHRALVVADGTDLVALNADGLTVTNTGPLPDDFMVYLEGRSGVMNVTNVTVNGVRLY
jgi:hypothetical protein